MTEQELLNKLNINLDTKVKDLSETETAAIRKELDNHLLEGDLRREVSMNIKRLQEINSYRGMRHRRNLPVRGQNTRNNCRTRKGKKKVVSGSSKKGKAV